MANLIRCHVDPAHGPSTMVFDGGRTYLCSKCSHARTVRQYAQRRPVGVIRQEGGR